MYVYDSVIVLKPKTDAVQLQYTYSKLYKVKIIIKRNPTNRESRDTLKEALREFKTVKKENNFFISIKKSGNEFVYLLWKTTNKKRYTNNNLYRYA